MAKDNNTLKEDDLNITAHILNHIIGDHDEVMRKIERILFEKGGDGEEFTGPLPNKSFKMIKDLRDQGTSQDLINSIIAERHEKYFEDIAERKMLLSNYGEKVLIEVLEEMDISEKKIDKLIGLYRETDIIVEEIVLSENNIEKEKQVKDDTLVNRSDFGKREIRLLCSLLFEVASEENDEKLRDFYIMVCVVASFTEDVKDFNIMEKFEKIKKNFISRDSKHDEKTSYVIMSDIAFKFDSEDTLKKRMRKFLHDFANAIETDNPYYRNMELTRGLVDAFGIEESQNLYNTLGECGALLYLIEKSKAITDKLKW